MLLFPSITVPATEGRDWTSWGLWKLSTFKPLRDHMMVVVRPEFMNWAFAWFASDFISVFSNVSWMNWPFCSHTWTDTTNNGGSRLSRVDHCVGIFAGFPWGISIVLVILHCGHRKCFRKIFTYCLGLHVEIRKVNFVEVTADGNRLQRQTDCLHRFRYLLSQLLGQIS